MKFQSINEMEQMSFDEAKINELKIESGKIQFTLEGAIIKAKNSQNGRFEDMYCGEIVLQLKNAEVVRIVKEGMKYYDANGELLKEIPNEDVPESARKMIFQKLASGTIFTLVKAEVSDGYGYEFGIDVPKDEDKEEVDTYWLCVTFERSVAAWDRYCSPVEGNS